MATCGGCNLPPLHTLVARFPAGRVSAVRRAQAHAGWLHAARALVRCSLADGCCWLLATVLFNDSLRQRPNSLSINPPTQKVRNTTAIAAASTATTPHDDGDDGYADAVRKTRHVSTAHGGVRLVGVWGCEWATTATERWYTMCETVC